MPATNAPKMLQLQQCKAGDLILLDVAAEYANYSSDMSRTIPVWPLH
jgi:Xaa-Pro aminopeptidase